MKSINEIVDLASAYYGSAVLFAAIDRNVFAAVESTDGSLAAIAKATGSSERGMRLLLDACVAEGLLEKRNDVAKPADAIVSIASNSEDPSLFDAFETNASTGNGGNAIPSHARAKGEVYRNTEAGRMALVPGGKADLTKAIRYNRDVYPAWGRLGDFVESGKPAERPEIHLGEDAARTKAFAAAMFGRAMGIGRSVIPVLGLAAANPAAQQSNNPTIQQSNNLKVLDLAGGPGAYAILMCQANPNLSCVTVDLPAISAEAQGYVAKFGLSDRIECRAGDYHSDEYEKGSYDIVTIFGALHQESPAQIVDILKRARRALKPGGRVIVLDMMTDATHAAPKFSALFAVNMALTTANGWVFSDAELKGWMREAGFEPGETVAVPPPMPHWIVSGRGTSLPFCACPHAQQGEASSRCAIPRGRVCLKRV